MRGPKPLPPPRTYFPKDVHIPPGKYECFIRLTFA